MHKEEGTAYHALLAADVLRAAGSRLQGLRGEEVRGQRAMHGENRLPHARRASAVRIFARQFKGAFVGVLLAALAVSVALGDTIDATLIGVIVALQALLGFAQEYRADRAFERLSVYLPQYAQVRRNGEVAKVRAEEVVVGDIVLVAAGDRVVADARILRSTQCETNEAALTGESRPTAKQIIDLTLDTPLADRTNMLFAGTTIASGTAEAVVVAVGARTVFGGIAKMTMATKEPETPLQLQLATFSRRLVFAVFVVVGVVLAWGLGKGLPAGDFLPLVLALAVAAIPEGLLVILTIILASSMQRMAHRKALVRSLLAAETLGGVTIICTDKTGTLTEGRMSVTALHIGGETVAPTDTVARELLECVLLNSSAAREVRDGQEQVSGTQTEVALLRFVQEQGIGMPKGRLIGIVPFDSRHKFSAKAYALASGRRLIAAGAPDVLLERADVSDVARGHLAATIESMSRRGLRVLLVAVRDTDVSADISAEDVRDMRVVGLIGMEDAVRAQVPEMIAEAGRAGIRTIMLTGDHPGTAQAVATAVGLPSSSQTTMTGVELALFDDHALRLKIGEISIFARIRPEDKLRIVRALQANGSVVAMTGDGVNDAPALRAADIGIAVGSGTDVAKEAADVVLLDNDFSTIVTAIREGRGVLDTIRKVVAYLMAGRFREFTLVLVALVIAGPLPLLPIHILWINVLSDGLAALALATEPAEPETMREMPRSRFAPLLRRELVGIIAIAAIVMDSVLVILYLTLFRGGVAPEIMRSIMFVALGLTSTLSVLAMRSFRRSALRMSLTANPALIVALLASISLLILPFFIPPLQQGMALSHVALDMAPFLALLAVVIVLVIESVKFVFVAQNTRGILRSL